MAQVIEALREEHRDIARLLDALEHEIGVFAEEGDPDYDVVRGVADYFLEFPDRCHHPKEDAVFARLKAVQPEAAAAVGDLPGEHVAVHARALRFEETVNALLNETDIARDAVVEAARKFVALERRHMQMEEERFFPVAERLLSADDWSGVEAGLAQGPDPLLGGAVEQRFRRLAERLVAWERQAR